MALVHFSGLKKNMLSYESNHTELEFDPATIRKLEYNTRSKSLIIELGDGEGHMKYTFFEVEAERYNKLRADIKLASPGLMVDSRNTLWANSEHIARRTGSTLDYKCI